MSKVTPSKLSIVNHLGALKQRITGDKLVLNAIYIFGNAIVTALFGFLFWTFASRLYSSSQVGIASSLLSIIQLLKFIGSLGLGFGMARFLIEDESPKDLFNSITLLSFLVVIFLGVLYLFFVPIFLPTLADAVTGIYPHLAIISLLLLITLFSRLDNLYVAIREAKYSLHQMLIMSFTRLMVVYLMRDLGIWGIVGALTSGYLIATILSSKYYLPRVLPDFKFSIRINWEKIRHIFSFSISNFVASIFHQTPTSLFPPMALEILGKASSAYVYMVYMLASFISSPGLALGNSALVESVYSPGNFKKIIKRASYLTLGITIALAGIVYLLAIPLLGFFGEGYVENASGLFKILIIASPFVAGNLVLVNYLRTKKYTRELVISSIIMAIISLGIPFATMNTIGMLAIGYGWILAQIIVIGYVLIAIRFLEKK